MPMKAQQRAMQFWSVLVVAARTQHLLSYKSVEQITGLPQRAQADFLGRVAWYCKRNKLPPLTTIVVSHRTGLPGLVTHITKKRGSTSCANSQECLCSTGWTKSRRQKKVSTRNGLNP